MPQRRVASVSGILATLKRKGSKRNRDGMARYAIVAPKVFGVSVSALRVMAKQIGRDHALAAALWATGWYEARMLATLVDDPAQVTRRQMDQWARDFDNWAICDTACFHLFDRTPHAWSKVDAWSKRREEFVKRAAFALIASLGVHDKTAPDAEFLRRLPLIARAATDERNFVKKAVSWALRVVGRRSKVLHGEAVALALHLKASDSRSARWIGSDAYRELTGDVVQRQLARRSAKAVSGKR